MSEKKASNFIRNIVLEDLKTGKHTDIITRFPPEPNGYLHIGHAKSIVLNFELADEFGGITNLRFDDTNPTKEELEYVQSIKEDVKWLGFDWENLFFASDYFEEMYKRAILLIEKGKAYVCELSPDEIREYRGTLTEPGTPSPYRDRSIEENLELFEEMKNGKYEDGSRVLRAKIDMASPNMNMRDPIIYRISHAVHHNTGDKWCIYPMYDYAHPLEDAIEGITHSLCTLEFEDHRPLYDWFVRECEMEHVPRQIEFARLNLTNTVMSKRKLKQLVDENIVDGWSDPRMPTISGLRRRGYTPKSIRDFCRSIGVAKNNSLVDEQMLEHFVREDLKVSAPRTMAVIDPVKVVITNYPENQVEFLDAENNSDNESLGRRQVPFSREIYIERDDFMEYPEPKYFRLYPGHEVRLKNAYFIKCTDIIKGEDGTVLEIHCTYDPETKSGTGFTARKVKSTIHWVSANHAVPAEFRIYEPLIVTADNESGDFLTNINPASLQITNGFIEPSMRDANPQDKFQLFRHGYFNVDECSAEYQLTLNKIVSLKSSFKMKK